MRPPRHARLLIVPLVCLSTSVIAQSAEATVKGAVGARLDSALRTFELRGFSGIVRVQRAGETLLEKGYGLANRADRIPFSPSTVVQIGSNTKDFTAVAILQLRERGRLALTDSIGKYFAGVPSDKRGITIQQLLDHRSGLPLGLGGDFDTVTKAQVIDGAMRAPLTFSPGTSDGYSNLGYTLLAAIIERLSGTSYDEYVRANILVPLGLHDTGLWLPKFDPRRVAHGYGRGEDKGTMLTKPQAADGPNWNLRGNGGMLSTVSDMHAFYQALFETDRLLPRAVAQRRFPSDEPVALAGSDRVSFFLFERLPGVGVELIVALNSNDVPPQDIRQAIGQILGLPSPDDGPPTKAPAGARPKVTPPPAAVAAVLSAFVHVLNAGDTAALRQFIVDHFIAAPGAPPAATRAQRLAATHDDLGELTLNGMDQVEPSVIEVVLTSPSRGRVTIRAQMDPNTPDRIATLQLMVGG